MCVLVCNMQRARESLSARLGVRCPTYFITSECNFAPASGATSNITIMTNVADAVRKLCLQANMARGVQLDARLLLLFAALPDRVFKHRDFILLTPVSERVGGLVDWLVFDGCRVFVVESGYECVTGCRYMWE